jgi:hypothetical protein
MNKAQLLLALQDARTHMETALAGLTEEQMVDPSVLDEWSIKDALSHLTAWEAEMVAALARAQRGLTPQLQGWSQSEIEALNAKWHKDHKQRALDQVQKDFYDVFQQLLSQVEALSEKALVEPKSWLRGGSLAERIGGYTYEHELEHAEQIQTWRREKLGQ